MKGDCRTHWIEQVIGMDTFEELFIHIVFCLKKKKKFNKDNNCNTDTSVITLSFFRLVSIF